MYPYVHSNTIHNNQDMETTGQGQLKCPWTDEWIKKWYISYIYICVCVCVCVCVCIHNRIVLTH